jgi:F420-non-reducing hydrogenase large subunit
MHTLGLAQEAAAILGGRSDHPVTAIAGGVSRFLKDGYYQRLTEIADACLNLVLKIDAFFREDLLNVGGPLHHLSETAIDPIPTATVVEGQIVLRNSSGKIVEAFPPEKAGEKIAVRREPWSYLPFAALNNGAAGPYGGGASPGSFLVGPLARMAGDDPLKTPEAETARQGMIEELGSEAKWTPAAGCRALLVDLIGAAERMTDLYKKENFLGPAIRTVPEKMGAEAWAALEGPAGLIVLGATVDGKGIVESIRVMDPIQINNGVRCRIAEAAVSGGLAQNRSHTDIKRRLENSLLPF